MIDTYNSTDTIRFRKDYYYDKVVPTFVSHNIGGTCEIARWVLDLNGMLYKDEPHAPYLYTNMVHRLTGNKTVRNSPVLINTDALIYTTKSLVQYYEQRSIAEKRLLPGEPSRRKEVLDLYN